MHLDLLAGNLDRRRAEVDLQLLARRRLETHRRARLRRELGAKAATGALDGAQADDHLVLAPAPVAPRRNCRDAVGIGCGAFLKTGQLARARRR
jgi:hypothetical protein